MDPVPDTLLLRKSHRAGNKTRDFWICSRKLWPLDHRELRRQMVVAPSVLLACTLSLGFFLSQNPSVHATTSRRNRNCTPSLMIFYELRYWASSPERSRDIQSVTKSRSTLIHPQYFPCISFSGLKCPGIDTDH
jgi:hypothetical protein